MTDQLAEETTVSRVVARRSPILWLIIAGPFVLLVAIVVVLLAK